jgi:hypothetical protein
MSVFFAIAARYWQAFAALAAAVGVLIYGRHQRGQGAAEREGKLRAEAAAKQDGAVRDAIDAAARVRDANAVDRDRLRDKWTRPN